MFMQW
jgi:ubiquitin carboxyl-terminal hydrolase 9/24